MKTLRPVHSSDEVDFKEPAGVRRGGERSVWSETSAQSLASLVTGEVTPPPQEETAVCSFL